MRPLLLLLSAAALFAQTLPSNWYGAGPMYGPSAPAGTSPVSGWAAYAHLAVPSAQMYSFSSYSVYFTKANGRYQPVTSAATGVLFIVRQFGPVTIGAFGLAGMASAASLGNAFPYGGLVDVKIGKTDWHIPVGFQQIPSSAAGVQTQKSILFGIGRQF